MGAGSKRVVRDDDSSSSDGEAVRDTGMHSTQKAAASADKGKGKGTSRKDGQGAVGMSKRRRGRDGSGSESEESGQGGDGAGRDAGLSLDLASVTDAHRLFVHMCMKEAGMQKGADAEAMATLHRHVCERTGGAVVADAVAWVGYNPSQNAFAAFMSALNEHLAFLDLEFASLADPDSGRRYWALVNTAADDVAQFATTLNANEIAFLKKVIQLIMTADDGVFQIPVSEALHESKLAKLTMQATETLIDTIIGSGWLAKNEHGWLRLGLRAIMELKTYLKEEFEDQVQYCSVCKELCTTSYEKCSDPACPGRLHKACSAHFYGDRVSAATRKCPQEGCDAIWEGISPVPNYNAPQRKRHAVDADFFNNDKKREATSGLLGPQSRIIEASEEEEEEEEEEGTATAASAEDAAEAEDSKNFVAVDDDNEEDDEDE
ncbi:Nse1 non-SMC component of SMC5-6 complex-domain-containing protein [Chytriomyces sp. MP71]|nr:Nse1 non-SMC component of SMC5-6 complex-domain-containing protein [Chytriomyces sp. MP71]